MKAGSKVVVEQHRHAGVFIARAKEDALCTLNSTPGKDVYGEKRISVSNSRCSCCFVRLYLPTDKRRSSVPVGCSDDAYSLLPWALTPWPLTGGGPPQR